MPWDAPLAHGWPHLHVRASTYHQYFSHPKRDTPVLLHSRTTWPNPSFYLGGGTTGYFPNKLWWRFVGEAFVCIYIFVYLSKKRNICISSKYEYIYIFLPLSLSLFHSFLPVFHSFILSFCHSFTLSLFLSFFLSFCLSVFLSFFLSFILSFFLSFCPSFFLSFFLYLSLPLSFCISLCKTRKIISLLQLNFFQN